jgi:ubiquinone/menaquinone biosynthesis C-methylase UbiE
MVIVSKLLDQVRKPAGWVGRLNLLRMNRRHSKLTDWGLGHVSIAVRDVILDVGCGGGKTISKLAAAAPEGRIYGIDHSEESVAASRRANQESIKAERVEIRAGSVSQLGFPDNMFDVVTAIETHYYWPDLVGDLREVLRVLKPGGTVVIIAEAYRGSKHDKVLRQLEKSRALVQFDVRGSAKRDAPFSLLSVDEHRERLAQAGYLDVRVFEEYEKSWICVIGHKPAGTQTRT